MLIVLMVIKKSVSSDQGYVIEELLNPATTGLNCHKRTGVKVFLKIDRQGGSKYRTIVFAIIRASILGAKNDKLRDGVQ